MNPKNLQYLYFSFLVKRIHKISSNHVYNCMGDENNVHQTMDLIYNVWGKMIHTWENKDYDYSILTKEIKELSFYSIDKKYSKCLDRSIEIICDIIGTSLMYPNSVYRNHFNDAEILIEIGKYAINNRNYQVISKIVLHLLDFGSNKKENSEKFHINALLLMSVWFEKDKAAFTQLKFLLKQFENQTINNSIQYTERFLKIEYPKLRRFVKAVKRHHFIIDKIH